MPCARTHLLALTALFVLPGCLQRPVEPAEPSTTNVFVKTISDQRVDKVDLLFMIDNSLSMADKQEILAQAVPVLVRRLVTPNCLDSDGNPIGVADTHGRCTTGTPAFKPVNDIHIGVITSSLGSHGGTECAVRDDDAQNQRTPDDHALLLPAANPAVRGTIDSWNGSGFLAWDPSGQKNSPPGDADLDHLVGDFTDQVQKTGENGCGYEGSLEAWYRFLVDPEPPASVTSRPTPDGKSMVTSLGPVNDALLAQRKAFLRPDSLLAIVMLTDENDCSINDDDGGSGWLVAAPKTPVPRASAACAQNPDDRCCHSCASDAPSGCTPNASDAECSKGTADRYPVLAASEDSANLRCFDQKRRFGVDLLYPTERYVKALTAPQVPNRAGALVTNPIFAAPPGLAPRAPNLVLLAGIVGVPWQDVATDDSQAGDGLRYLTATELEAKGRWSLMLGDGTNAPTDPFMRESVAERSGTHPLTGAPIVPSSAPAGQSNPINGREQHVTGNDDLQYACTFPLHTPRACNDANSESCDCRAKDRPYARSLCTYDGPEGTDGVQIAAKAYPGVRELSVLHAVGDNGIVASICPKHIEPAAGLRADEDPSYGYNPAIAAMLGIFVDRLVQQCLPRPLPVETDASSADFGHVPCAVVEATRQQGGACACDTLHGRSPVVAQDLPKAVHDQLRSEGRCGGGTGIDCNDYCLCKLDELDGAARAACENGQDDGASFGYCYIDPDQGIGNPALVSGCPATQRRSLQFVGDNVPAKGAVTFMACEGAAITAR